MIADMLCDKYLKKCEKQNPPQKSENPKIGPLFLKLEQVKNMEYHWQFSHEQNHPCSDVQYLSILHLAKHMAQSFAAVLFWASLCTDGFLKNSFVYAIMTSFGRSSKLGDNLNDHSHSLKKMVWKTTTKQQWFCTITVQIINFLQTNHFT